MIASQTRPNLHCPLRWAYQLAAAIGILAVAGSAAAQTPSDAQTYYRWTAPTAAQQLAADATVIPAGMGALFVPAMSDGQDEPEPIIYAGDRQVATGTNGHRIIVAPGSYTVRVGSGPTPQMVTVPVQVTAGMTAVVPVTWGGLKVDVVNANNIPHRGSFELIRVSDRQPYTVGFGADTLVGERLRTLLMPPGLYRIVRPGSNYRARTDFATVLVPEGSLVHFKLVLDEDTGQLLGSGVVSPEELGIVPEGSAWSNRITLGLGLSLASTSNVVGATNQTALGATAYFDTYSIYSRGKNYGSIVFEVEEGFVRLDPDNSDALPIQKTQDRIRLDTLYTRFMTPRVGPYVRFGLLTNAFESRVLVTEDTTVVKHFLDNTTTTEFLQANDDFHTGDAFAPVLLRQGVGVNVRLLRSRASFLDWRVGLGTRQSRYRGAFTEEDDSIPGTLVYREVESFNQAGLETTIVGTLRLRRLLLNTNFDLFGDFNDFDEPTIDWRNTVSYRLTGDLSLDYRVDVLRLPQVTTDTQVTQNLLFRYSWGR